MTAALQKAIDQPSCLESKFQGKNKDFRLLVWKKIASGREFLSLGLILERLEINVPSAIQRELLQITCTSTDNGFNRTSHRTGQSLLNPVLGRYKEEPEVVPVFY